MENSGYSERIKDIRHHLKMNQAEFAVHTNILRSAISEFENGKREPTREFIETLSDMGISIDWFLTGTGPMMKPTNSPYNKKDSIDKPTDRLNSPLSDTPASGTIESSRQNPPGVPLIYAGDSGLNDGIVIPLLENAASAGYGEELDEDDVPVRYVQVPRYLSKYPHLASLPVKGDSMEPTLHDGDLVVCDGGGWDGDGIYVLKTYDTAYVKRVQLSTDGYKVISDNKMYDSFTESVEKLSIVGKVRAILVIVPGRRGGV